MEEQTNKKLYFSLFSGQIYEVPEDEVKNLDEAQIPLLERPKQNCNKCFGRGYIYKDIKSGFYTVCKCMKDKINFN